MNKRINKRTVLTISSCIGVAATIVTTYLYTRKAQKEIKDENLPIKEELKLTWKYYILPVSIGAATITTIIINQKLSSKEIAAILGAAGLSGSLLKEYQAKTKELIGEERFNDIRKAIAHDHEDGIVVAAVPEIYTDGLLTCQVEQAEPGRRLFYDEFTQTWFRSSKEAVRLAEYSVNRNFTMGADVSLANFYEFLGLKPEPGYHKLFWGMPLMEDGVYWVDFEHTDSETEDTNEPYTIISYPYGPEELGEDYL